MENLKLIKEGNEDVIKNLKDLKSKNCVPQDFKIVNNPINQKIALYKKTEKGNWIFVYDDLTFEGVNPSTKEVLKTSKISCEGYNTPEQKIEQGKKEEEKINTIKTDNKVVEDAVNSAGYTLITPPITSGRYNERMDIRLLLGGKYAKYYKDLGGDDSKVIYVYPLSDIKFDESSTPSPESEDPGVYAKSVLKKVKESRLAKNDCRNVIKTLYDIRQNKSNPEDKVLMNLKRYAYACSKQNINWGNKIQTKFRELKSDSSLYGLEEFYKNQARLSVNENSNERINLFLNESLKKLSNEKSIIQNRLNTLNENVKISNEKSVDLYFDKIITETVKLNNEGYNSELINEGLLDIIKGMFGNASEGIFGYFKERLAKWFVKTFTPLDPDSWLGTMIVTAIGNVPITELGQLTNCNYVSKILTKTIVETLVAKFQNERGLTGPGFEIIRNTLVETAEDSAFGQKLENNISKFLCPKLSKVSDKLDIAKDKIKEKAFA